MKVLALPDIDETGPFCGAVPGLGLPFRDFFCRIFYSLLRSRLRVRSRVFFVVVSDCQIGNLSSSRIYFVNQYKIGPKQFKGVDLSGTDDKTLLSGVSMGYNTFN